MVSHFLKILKAAYKQELEGAEFDCHTFSKKQM